MQIITIYDFLLLPVYLSIFYFFVKHRSIKITDADLRKIFLVAFGLRMFGSIAYSFLVQYYYGYGDSFTYYNGGDFIVKQILADFGNLKYLFLSAEELQRIYSIEEGSVGGVNGYIGISSAVAVMKASAVISALSFNKFLITSLFFGLFSFAGQWKLFLVFNDINEGKHKKLMAFAVLYTPSIWFWGSGLMKESICLGALGFIIHFLYKIFIKKKVVIRDLLALVVLVYLVLYIKSYIIIILAVSLSTFIFYSLISIFKNILIKAFIVLIFIFTTSVIAFVLNFDEQLKLIVEESKAQFDTYQKNYQAVLELDESSRAGVKSTEIDTSVKGLLLQSNVAIFTCLFRPFIWESRKIIILFSSLESMLLLFSTLFLLFKMRFVNFFGALFSNQYLLFSFVLSILFALIIGFTTYNFGTMVRYKIMLLPFYYFMLVQLYSMQKKKTK